ncbi:MAG TPA: hypothetical protein PLP19_05715 [bacterium]|nr:hypothetical protein [bacterium]HPN42964.1 hypothetical protein [bacterium]
MQQCKFIFIILLLSGFFINCGRNLASPENQVTPTKNDHFEFVLYDELSTAITSDIIKELENNFSRITTAMQITVMPKVKVQIWGDESHYLEDQERIAGRRYPGSTGYVSGLDGMCLLFRNNSPQAAVHEFANVVSLNVNSSIGNNPRWLWEAVAVYYANDFTDPGVLSYIKAGDYPTIAELNADFNSGNHKIYQLGYSLVEYIISRWGEAAIVNLIKSNGNIKTSLHITTTEFESGWRSFIENKYLDAGK